MRLARWRRHLAAKNFRGQAILQGSFPGVSAEERPAWRIRRPLLSGNVVGVSRQGDNLRPVAAATALDPSGINVNTFLFGFAHNERWSG